jgi:hypothetical protein
MLIYILYSIPGKADQLNKIIFIYIIMDYRFGVGPNGEGQRPEIAEALELRPDQLQIGILYRIQEYRDNERRGGPYLAKCENKGRYLMKFTKVPDGSGMPIFDKSIDIPADTNQTHRVYYRFFQPEGVSLTGGRKYKTRQTKLRRIRRKNRTRKNRRRTNRRR